VIWVNPPIATERAKAIWRLLKRDPGDGSDGRTSLYVCAECGDLGCGAITVRIDETPDEIIWWDFGFEYNVGGELERNAYSSLGPFRFDRPSYEAELKALLPD
jgi:hypothetical protein